MEHGASRSILENLHGRRGQLALMLALTGSALVALALAEARRPEARPELIDLAEALQVQWVGMPAPDFDLPLQGGGRFTDGDLDGPPVLVHFWASWCPSCLPELKLFGELRQRYGPQELRLVHVSLDEEWNAARQVLPQPWTMELALDRSSRVARAFGTEKLPEAYLIDAHGQVLLRFVANQPWLEPRMLQLLDGFVRK
ncbi:MAG: TlpA family protein disulfide reductase [Deltaproteobacteria bacterium]|nr:TlpA family protein disulfide reductase [Deltaproteobacteria bacterium]